MNLDYLITLNDKIASVIALITGDLRGGPVGISGCNIYKPPVPVRDEVETQLANVMLKDNPTERALDLFAWVAKSQLFWDGNKRTAQLAANKVLIENGAGIMAVAPDMREEFSLMLHNFYDFDQKDELKQFLYDKCMDGTDFSVDRKRAKARE
jgi:hypothetical protein